jgi:hypothetical protein
MKTFSFLSIDVRKKYLMASSSSSKALCATCGNKSIGVFKCEGCSQTFCRKHSNEHRDFLIHQLDEIVLEHDTLQQTITEYKEEASDSHRLIDQINEWERDSIVKIQQTAKEGRQHVEKLLNDQNGNLSKINIFMLFSLCMHLETISSNLHDLAERLRTAREDDDFVESDLRQWTVKLQKLKDDMTNIHRTITVCEDPSTILVNKLNITAINERLEEDESLMRACGSVQIENNGRIAIQRDAKIVSYVRGKKEYSVGRHKIRFNINKTELHIDMVFGIISKTEKLSEWPSSHYGWSNNDLYYCDGKYYNNGADAETDLKDMTSFTIELLLDCDDRKIQYFNEQTKKTRDLNVNLKQCPFPWQIFFYLHSAGDCVQLL